MVKKKRGVKLADDDSIIWKASRKTYGESRMKGSIFIKIWMPIMFILGIIITSFVFIDGNQTEIQLILLAIMFVMIALQLLDVKYKFNILN